MAIIRIWTGTGAPAISVAVTAVWFQSVTASARAPAAAPRKIDAPRQSADTNPASLEIMVFMMRSSTFSLRPPVSQPQRAVAVTREVEGNNEKSPKFEAANRVHEL